MIVNTIPVIAIIGRPNVGKSTLFNCLTRSRQAIVADLPGVTRDRLYGEAWVDDIRCLVIDTGGMGEVSAELDALMAEQSELAILEADKVFFLVDGRAGLTAGDLDIARHCRQLEKPVFCVVNKVDGMQESLAAGDFYRLGFSEVHCISAAHNRGVKELLKAALPKAAFGPDDPSKKTDKGIEVAIIGRPNVGKSTLVNRLLGEERVIVYDMPGTTRDSLAIPFERRGQLYTLIDTAGVRRRRSVEEGVEKFSVVKTLQSIEAAKVIVMVFDAKEGITDQDLHIIGFALDAGRALILAFNKWDGMTAEARDWLKRETEARLAFLDHTRKHWISALHGSGVGDLFVSIDEAYEAAGADLSTPRLTRILADAVTQHQPPLVKGRRIKLRYAHQGGQFPPRIIIHGNQTEDVPSSYKRFLVNVFRQALGLKGTPLFLEFRTGDNPFKDKVNQLTLSQERKRKRLMKYVKERKRKK